MIHFFLVSVYCMLRWECFWFRQLLWQYSLLAIIVEEGKLDLKFVSGTFSGLWELTNQSRLNLLGGEA